MNSKINNKNKIVILSILALLFALIFLFYDIKPGIFEYTMGLRLPRFVAIILAAICIGSSTYIFQTLTSNVIITPSLLGMNSLYTLLNTSIVFLLGSSSLLFVNSYLSYGITLILMGISAIVIYGYIFDKTNNNILLILLIGTIVSTLFGSIQQSMIRIMDPNEYDSLLNSLIASFSNVNSALIGVSIVLIILCFYIFRKEISYLNVLILGKTMSINLGVDYNLVSKKLLIFVSLLIAICTSLVGPITFLGLIVVNIARNIFKSYKYNLLMIGSVLLGIIFLFGSQFIIQHIFVYAVPISVFVNLFGGIYFLILLLRERGKM